MLGQFLSFFGSVFAKPLMFYICFKVSYFLSILKNLDSTFVAYNPDKASTRESRTYWFIIGLVIYKPPTLNAGTYAM